VCGVWCYVPSIRFDLHHHFCLCSDFCERWVNGIKVLIDFVLLINEFLVWKAKCNVVGSFFLKMFSFFVLKFYI
jgi:hypothetical protein